MRPPHITFPCGCQKVDNVYFPSCGEHEFEDLLNFEAQEVVADWYEAEMQPLQEQVLQEVEDILRIAED